MSSNGQNSRFLQYGSDAVSQPAKALNYGRVATNGQKLQNEIIPLEPGSGGMSINAGALDIGDIIVSTTEAFISKRIRNITKSEISHSMIYVGNGFVIEAISSGVTRRQLSVALSDATLAVALRYNSLRTDIADKISAYATARVGKDYDYWAIVKQALYRLDRKVFCDDKPSPEFGECIDKFARINLGTESDNDKYFCSELILEAFQANGVPLTRRKPHWDSPADIPVLHSKGKLNYVGHLKFFYEN